MEPTYMNENRYSYLVGSWNPPSNIDYQVENPENEFERRVQYLFLEGQAHLRHEEFGLALQTFRELMNLILYTVDPKMPIDPNIMPWIVFPLDVSLVDTLAAKSVEILKNTPETTYNFPASIISQQSILPQSVHNQLKPALEVGLERISYSNEVNKRVEAASTAMKEAKPSVALNHYAAALASTPVADTVLRASILHDMAILAEKTNDQTRAAELAKQGTELFKKTTVSTKVEALNTLKGILDRATGTAATAGSTTGGAVIRRTETVPSAVTRGPTVTAAGTAPTVARVAIPAAIAAPITIAPALMTMKYIETQTAAKALKITSEKTTATIKLDSNATTNAKAFLQTVSMTMDIQLITTFWYTPVQMVAYLPHMYFFIIPMAIGDCLAGMGNLKQAEQQYLSVLPYPYINKNYEIIKLWTRLAQLYLDIGDQAYRNAKDNLNAFISAREAYENIVLHDKKLKPNSQLYANSKFASIKTRVTNFLKAPDPVAYNDNPAITRIVLEAHNRLEQITAGFNFFGFPLEYVPPFSFEYLQSTARYFAQQASQVEQRYIQYKSQAENEELRREQLDQQAEVARQSVVLEQRGVAEASAGIAVAQAGLDYAEVQRQNAVKSSQDFQAVRWELLELTSLEAWANAAAVDQDDEVKQTISGYSYYNVDHKRRSLVVQDLAYRRTKISHELEAKKLQRAIDSAAAYKQVAQAQVSQAQARKAIAEQRVKIAQLQQRQAEENRDFLDMRQFSAHLWYEIALQARRLKQRYLDMANEIAFLMERAYNAETERNLRLIRYDYTNTSSNLMGADLLLADIDYFTYDYVTTTKTKKIPVKQIISLADSYSMSFQQLLTTGQCLFQTELEDFDRQHPGMYLCKLRNVELVFVGIQGPSTISGTLRNIGISRFRRPDGSIIARLYPSDVMALSQYEIRQDALAFRFNPNDLRLFENNGIATFWQLDLPMDANPFNYQEILDIQLVLYYDGFFSPTLESTIKATLPASGTAQKAFSLRMSFFDELYYLKNEGEAQLVFEPNLFPANQKNFKRTQITLKVLGETQTIQNLKIRLTSANHSNEIILTTDQQGEVNQNTPGQPLNALLNELLMDEWTLKITEEDNPTLVQNGKLDLTGLTDLLIFFEYSFDYR